MSALKSKEILSYKIQSFIVGLVFACLVFGVDANSSFAQQVGNTEKIRDLAATPEKLSASFAEIAKRVERHYLILTPEFARTDYRVCRRL